jgi:hypothetical protein
MSGQQEMASGYNRNNYYRGGYNNNGRNYNSNAYSQPKVNVYHYTDSEGLDAIQRTGVIEPSRQAKYGQGV